MKLSLLAAAAVALAPAAHAQSGCDLVNKIVSAAPTAFTALRGEEIDEDWYDTNTAISGAEECSIDTSGAPAYSCVWTEKATAPANIRVGSMIGMVRPCLTGWAEKPLTGEKSFNNLSINTGIAFTGGGANAGTVVKLYNETLDATQTDVWFHVERPKGR